MRIRKRWAIGLFSALLLLAVAAIAGMKPGRELELEVLKGREPDRIEDQGRGGHSMVYRFEADLEQVVTELEMQLGAPKKKLIGMDHADWNLDGTQVSASRGKMFLSPEESVADNRRRLKAKMGSYEWLISQGYDKWVTIEVRQEPSSFSRFWFRLQDIFHW
jgi:hypothetical protein